MDVAWQDGAGSFLDWSGSDLSGSFASLASGDGSVLWSSSADTPLFSGDSVLWESTADSPAGSHLSAFDPSASETDGTPTRSWITSGTSGLLVGSSSLDSGLLWAGAGSDTSASLNSGSGLWLGALDLGAGSGPSSQWLQFVNDFANRSATGFSDIPTLLWSGGERSAVTPPITGDPLHLASSFAGPSFPTLAPEHLVFTDPAGAAAPIMADATLSRLPSGFLVPPQTPNGVPASLVNARL